jgi:hypothetical protein
VVEHRLPRVLLVSAALLTLAACSSEPERELSFAGPEDGAYVNAEQLDDLAVEVIASWDDPAQAQGEPDIDDLRVLLDDEDRSDEAEVDDTRLRWSAGDLPDGEHTVRIASQPTAPEDEDAEDEDEDGEAEDSGDDGEDEPEVLETFTFTVDTTPPQLELTSPDGAVVAGEPLTVAGTTEPDATVTVQDEEVPVDEEGAFEVELDQAPDGELEIEAVDRAGNSTGDGMQLVTVPSRVEADEIRTVHVSFCAWRSPSLRDPIIELIEDGTITALQLDLKDEGGHVGFRTDNEFAALTGADSPDCQYDLDEAVAQLHDLEVPVVGRIVAFADPVLAAWAWENEERDMVVQTEGGEKYVGAYNGFSNLANDEVLDYNIAIAEEAAAAGVDHILWDYIRKPDGSGARFPGLDDGDPEDAIVEFTRMADERLAPYGIEHGASVYGVSADRPSEVAQDIPRMSEYLDYVAPMIYPSHWAAGEYGVENPLQQPYDMVEATLEKWFEATDGSRARVLPWLEDSNYPVSLGYSNRQEYVEEQIRATYGAGIDEWMLWDSSVNYTTAAMTRVVDEEG